MKHRFIFLLLFMALQLSGCCMFVPCHPGTWALGFVTDMKGEPILNATVSLYGKRQITKSGGCFNFALADALPFTFTAEAAGFKPIEVPRKIGYFRISVKLAPIDSNSSSEVFWKEISSEEYSKAKPCS